MLSTPSGQLPPSLVVLEDQTSANRERFGDFGHRAGRQPQHRSDDVQPVGAISHGLEVLLLDRPESAVVQPLQSARLPKVANRNRLLPQGAARLGDRLVAGAKQAWGFPAIVRQSARAPTRRGPIPAPWPGASRSSPILHCCKTGNAAPFSFDLAAAAAGCIHPWYREPS